MLFKLIFALALLCHYSYAHTYHTGGCPAVEPMTGFEMKQVRCVLIFGRSEFILILNIAYKYKKLVFLEQIDYYLHELVKVFFLFIFNFSNTLVLASIKFLHICFFNDNNIVKMPFFLQCNGIIVVHDF